MTLEPFRNGQTYLTGSDCNSKFKIFWVYPKFQIQRLQTGNFRDKTYAKLATSWFGRIATATLLRLPPLRSDSPAGKRNKQIRRWISFFFEFQTNRWRSRSESNWSWSKITWNHLKSPEITWKQQEKESEEKSESEQLTNFEVKLKLIRFLKISYRAKTAGYLWPEREI